MTLVVGKGCFSQLVKVADFEIVIWNLFEFWCLLFEVYIVA